MLDFFTPETLYAAGGSAFVLIAQAIVNLIKARSSARKEGAEAKKINAQTDVIISDNLADGYSKLIKEYDARLKDYDQKLKEAHEENKQLREESESRAKLLIRLEQAMLAKDHQLMMVQASTIEIPYPYWIKERTGKMLILNDHYEKIYGKALDEYKGKTDIEVWGQEIGAKFWQHDLRVIRTRKKWEGLEELEIDGEKQKHRVVKWPIFDPLGKEVMFLAGMSIPPLNEGFE